MYLDLTMKYIQTIYVLLCTRIVHAVFRGTIIFSKSFLGRILFHDRSIVSNKWFFHEKNTIGDDEKWLFNKEFWNFFPLPFVTSSSLRKHSFLNFFLQV